jgi:hypothetical protein
MIIIRVNASIIVQSRGTNARMHRINFNNFSPSNFKLLYKSVIIKFQLFISASMPTQESHDTFAFNNSISEFKHVMV